MLGRLGIKTELIKETKHSNTELLERLGIENELIKDKKRDNSHSLCTFKGTTLYTNETRLEGRRAGVARGGRR